MNAEDTVTACIIVIGNEILSGRTREANVQFLARRLADLGIWLAEARVLPDDEALIARAVNRCRASYHYVFTTGGIGPTHDDVTSAAIAKAFGVALERNADAFALLRQQYKSEDMTPERLKMADLPVGAALIDNPVSRAPGFRLGNVFVLAGVPRIMQAMFEGIANELAGGKPLVSQTVAAFVPEGTMAGGLARLQEGHPQVEVGSYPFVRDGKLGVSVVLRGPEADSITAAAEEVEKLIRSLGAEPVDVGAE